MHSTSQPAHEFSDRELIRETLEGDRRQFEKLVTRYQDRLFTAMAHEVGCPMMAEDIVQEAFVRALRYLESFRQESEFYTWLYRIALNLRTNQMRRKKMLSLDSDYCQSFDLQTRHLDAPASRLERHEHQEQVREALGRLEERDRSILILREFEGFDYQSIANILDLKMGTVRSRIARARAKLKDQLRSYATDLVG